MNALLTAACALTLSALASPLFAETIDYPKNAPLFTIQVPDDWQVHLDGKGPLMVQTEDLSVVAVFDSRLSGVKDLATAKEAVAVQKKETAKTTGYTDFREISPIKEMKLNDRINAVGAQYHAKLPTGEPCIYIVAIFSPDGTNYCSAEISVKARGLLPAVEKQWHGLLDSITPAEAEAEEETENE